MLSLLNPSLLLAALLALLGAFGAGYFKGGESERGKAAQALVRAQAKAEAERQEAQDREQAIAAKYAALSAQNRAKTAQTSRKVEHALQADSCAATALPSELRDVFTAAQASLDRSKPDESLLLAPTRPASDVGGLGSLLHGGTGRIRGLLGQTAGAR